MMLTAKQQEALRQIAQASVQAERETGCPAELSAAQAILESAWLTRCPGNNCFGIKDTDRYPSCVYCYTKEFLDGQWQTCQAAFEAYPTLGDCFVDHARLIQRGPYAAAWQQYQADRDLDRLIAGIARSYATDPAYAANVQRLARGPNVAAAIVTARERA